MLRDLYPTPPTLLHPKPCSPTHVGSLSNARWVHLRGYPTSAAQRPSEILTRLSHVRWTSLLADVRRRPPGSLDARWASLTPASVGYAYACRPTSVVYPPSHALLAYARCGGPTPVACGRWAQRPTSVGPLPYARRARPTLAALLFCPLPPCFGS
eukprot:CAMPEP_0173415576 /NCGR_PEP_ID=MMETSP1356-20130122/84933_1 /TAXON_ID=77927 ORGANISM="Hemiselmis virescens, Strain PCC157" /NCGR_SAMPLE_ID=MMETSP1356 /ASSEMBLY_ACC=CAM_ASM_000847 /LENGTH=154 /DNA_ID=CAMNT_0014377827 /DNA_START=600 /DNA_END=1060 /DNA_ORIENTATION=-